MRSLPAERASCCGALISAQLRADLGRDPKRVYRECMRFRSVAAATFLTFSFVGASAQEALPRAAQVRVLCSNGVKAVIEQLRADLEQTLGYPLAIEFSTAVALKSRIDRGEPFDVAILTPVLIDDLAKQGKLAASRTELARSGVGVGFAVTASRPDVSTTAALRRTLLAAKSVVFTADGQSRTVIDTAFAKLGITEQMRAKTLLTGPGEAPLRVAAGEVELVLTLISEIVPVPGLQLAGPLPPELQGYVAFAAGVSSDARARDAALELVQLLARPSAATVFEAHGMEPIRSP